MKERPVAAKDEHIVSVTEERVEIGRRVVDTGRTLRVRKEVREVPSEVVQPQYYDRVEAERVPIGRVLKEAVGIRHEGDVTIIPVIEERLVAHKELVLVEEIRLTRRREVQEVRGQVMLRQESVVIERFDPATQQWLSEES